MNGKCFDSYFRLRSSNNRSIDGGCRTLVYGEVVAVSPYEEVRRVRTDQLIQRRRNVEIYPKGRIRFKRHTGKINR